MKTETAFILDRSSSISSMTHAAISGFNSEVPPEEIRGGEVTACF
jgi:hypothetical protein